MDESPQAVCEATSKEQIEKARNYDITFAARDMLIRHPSLGVLNCLNLIESFYEEVNDRYPGIWQ